MSVSAHPLFYDYMRYPVPTNKELYTYIDEIKYTKKSSKIIQPYQTFSREQHNDYIDDYIEYIKKRGWLYRSLPFVRQIYLCNSITFNALHSNSDIDICIITQSGYLRRARFRSLLLFWIVNIKRIQSLKTRSFCLSFYIDEKHSNIYHLRHADGDTYLPYRLAHCVLLYTDEQLPSNFLREKNQELLSFLPNHPLHQSILIGSPLYTGVTWFKKSIEQLGDNKLGKILQQCISWIRKPILYYKTSKFKKHIQEEIIISDGILKFHDDKRHIFQFRKRNSNSKGVSIG